MVTPTGSIEEAYKRNVPERKKILELIKNLDKNPDKLHMDITPAAMELGKLDAAHIIPFLKEALLSKNQMTRLHAQTAISYSLLHKFGFVIGKGWTTPKGEEDMKMIWKKNGDYKFDASETDRRESVEKWLTWAITVD